MFVVFCYDQTTFFLFNLELNRMSFAFVFACFRFNFIASFVAIFIDANNQIHFSRNSNKKNEFCKF